MWIWTCELVLGIMLEGKKAAWHPEIQNITGILKRNCFWPKIDSAKDESAKNAHDFLIASIACWRILWSRTSSQQHVWWHICSPHSHPECTFDQASTHLNSWRRLSKSQIPFQSDKANAQLRLKNMRSSNSFRTSHGPVAQIGPVPTTVHQHCIAPRQGLPQSTKLSTTKVNVLLKLFKPLGLAKLQRKQCHRHWGLANSMPLLARVHQASPKPHKTCWTIFLLVCPPKLYNPQQQLLTAFFLCSDGLRGPFKLPTIANQRNNKNPSSCEIRRRKVISCWCCSPFSLTLPSVNKVKSAHVKEPLTDFWILLHNISNGISARNAGTNAVQPVEANERTTFIETHSWKHSAFNPLIWVKRPSGVQWRSIEVAVQDKGKATPNSHGAVSSMGALQRLGLSDVNWGQMWDDVKWGVMCCILKGL